MARRMALWMMAVLLCVLTSCNALDNTPLGQYQTTVAGDIIYKRTLSGALGLEIRQPTANSDGENPAVLVFHGGGWISGSREEFYREFESLCDELLASGIAVIGVSYRLAGDGLTWRDCLDDCVDALDFIVDHAEKYGIDAEHIGVMGYSAGAHLALMTAIESDDVDYCVSISGPVMLGVSEGSPYYSDALEYYRPYLFKRDSGADYYAASPLALISKKCDADFLLVNGMWDTVIPPSHAQAFYDDRRFMMRLCRSVSTRS